MIRFPHMLEDLCDCPLCKELKRTYSKYGHYFDVCKHDKNVEPCPHVWIKVEDKLPPRSEWVLVLYDEEEFKTYPSAIKRVGPMGVAFVYDLPDNFEISWSCMWKVSHWTYLPNKPQEEK